MIHLKKTLKITKKCTAFILIKRTASYTFPHILFKCICGNVWKRLCYWIQRLSIGHPTAFLPQTSALSGKECSMFPYFSHKKGIERARLSSHRSSIPFSDKFLLQRNQTRPYPLYPIIFHSCSAHHVCIIQTMQKFKLST